MYTNTMCSTNKLKIDEQCFNFLSSNTNLRIHDDIGGNNVKWINFTHQDVCRNFMEENVSQERSHDLLQWRVLQDEINKLWVGLRGRIDEY